jgi:hypothetical protein
MLKLLHEDVARSVLIDGPPEALKMLGELLLAVAHEEAGSSFSISPNGAGRFHFSRDSELGIYIHHNPVGCAAKPSANAITNGNAAEPTHYNAHAAEAKSA